MIPENIKREHILNAIEEVERSEIPRDRSSDKYDLEYNKKIYPPKFIVSLNDLIKLKNKYNHGIINGVSIYLITKDEYLFPDVA
jgi:hypothetical protein